MNNKWEMVIRRSLDDDQIYFSYVPVMDYEPDEVIFDEEEEINE